MFREIQLNLNSRSKIIRTSKNIYSNDGGQIPLSINETFINLTNEYNEQLFLNNSDIWYILFNGKKIKQPLQTKKTVIAIEREPYKDIYEELSVLESFKINQQVYNLMPVENIVLCDLLFAQGGIFGINEIHSALFLPYFLDNAKVLDNAKAGFKITFIFINLLISRF